MKKKVLIRNLEAELLKLKKHKKDYDTFETRYDVMIEDVLDYVKNSIPKEKLSTFIDGELEKINEDKSTNKDVLYGMSSAYLATKNIFCGGNK